ncbi:RTX toxin [Rhizobium rhizoryzae]|uniref:RTX toxin n=1 Tax=Rhizobium rhizoryzae TaxID=451876 RepID=UPI00289C3DE6|nr:RTX toxin [Rhizobium rhizoryzae]
MSTISGFFRSPNAARDIDLLFSTPKAAGSTTYAGNRPPAVPADNEPNASQRALSRIIEIITLNSSEAQDKATMEEQLGYVTAGTGGEGDDTLTVTGRGITNIDAGAGNDSLILKSDSISDIRTVSGDDSIKAAGAFVGSIDGGDGNDDIQIKAKLALDLLGGAGDDTMKVAADTIRNLDAGDGNDNLVLEGNRIFARGGLGNDTVSIKATGADPLIEYGFGRGDGQDTVRSTSGLAIALGSLTANDLDIAVSGNTLTASIKGSEDRITITLDGKTTASFSFAVKDGQTMLRIN